MKKNIHPKQNPVVFIDVSTEKEFPTFSSVTSKETKNINGVKHHVIPVQISSSSHPFYTGKHRIIDTENLVDKFQKRSKKAKTLSEKLKASKTKKTFRKKSNVKSTKETSSLTLKDMLKQVR